jgi:membrane-bound ClpP family serine protease
VATALIVLGAVLMVFTFLLAFTIYSDIAAVVGLICVVTGAVMLSRRAPGRGAGAPEQR